MDEYEIAKKALARAVRVGRAKADLTQEELADIANLERTQISQIERQIANPSLRILVQLATAMGTDVSRLLSADPPDLTK